METDSTASATSCVEPGFGLVVTMIVLLLISVLGSALIVAVSSDLTVSSNYQSGSAAFYQADSGLEQTVVDLNSDSTWVADVLDTSTTPFSIADPFPTSLTINGNTITLVTEGGDVVQGYHAYGDIRTLYDGTHQREIFLPPNGVTFANATGRDVWVEFPMRSTGNAGSPEPGEQVLSATLRARISRRSAWDNALFANRGQSGLMLAGNAQIRGSVHIIGDPDDPTNIQWTGGSFIKNHYDGIDSNQDLGSDASKLPQLPSWEYNGETVTTLDSVVRVKHGDVTLSGSASWGEEDVSGNAFKETLDGFYTDGDVTTTGNASVSADGTGGYDADGVGFPTLDDPYTSGGVTYGSHRDYLTSQGLTVPVSEIGSDTPAFSYSDAKGNRIQWDPISGELDIDGIVLFSDDVTIGSAGVGGGGGVSSERIEYRGTGTLYANGDINVHGDLVPVGSYVADDSGDAAHSLGLVADRDVNIGQASWVTVMAAIYAEETTSIGMQSRVAGAVVTDHYDLGSQVPRLYHVPSLYSNLPPGMPGGPNLTISTVELRDWYHQR